MAGGRFQAQVLKQALHLRQLPISAAGGPLNRHSSSITVALDSDWDKGAPYPLEVANMLPKPLKPPRFELVNLLPWGAAGAGHGGPEERVFGPHGLYRPVTPFGGRDVLSYREADVFAFGI